MATFRQTVKRLFLSALMAFAGLSGGSLAAQELSSPGTFDMYRHEKILGLREAQAPELWMNRLVLTQAPHRARRWAAASFEHEHFTRSHNYVRNPYGVYVLIVPLDSLPRDTVLRYRVILDGLWTSDPTNPAQERHTQGFLVSTLPLGPEPRRGPYSPLFLADGRVEFQFQGPTGYLVTLMGSFNLWDPFSLPLSEDPQRPGFYSVALRLPPGTHYYLLMVGTEKILDPNNGKLGRGPDNRVVNFLEVPFRPIAAFTGP